MESSTTNDLFSNKCVKIWSFRRYFYWWSQGLCTISRSLLPLSTEQVPRTTTKKYRQQRHSTSVFHEKVLEECQMIHCGFQSYEIVYPQMGPATISQDLHLSHERPWESHLSCQELKWMLELLEFYSQQIMDRERAKEPLKVAVPVTIMLFIGGNEVNRESKIVLQIGFKEKIKLETTVRLLEPPSNPISATGGTHWQQCKTCVQFLKTSTARQLAWFDRQGTGWSVKTIFLWQRLGLNLDDICNLLNQLIFCSSKQYK